MNEFHYVYILVSTAPPGRYYVGMTADLSERLKQHNRRGVPHTGKFGEWMIKTAVAFRDHKRAAAFERYLESASGRAFAKKHL